MLSWLWFGDNGKGEATAPGEMGEIPLGVLEPDFESMLNPLSESLASDALRGLAPSR